MSSKALEKINIFSKKEFKDGSFVEKSRMVLLDNRLEEQLSDWEFQRWTKIQQAFSLCHKQFDSTKAIRVIRSHIEGCIEWNVANKLYYDMCNIYGPFQARNREMSRSIMVQRLWTIGVRLEQSGELEKAAKVFVSAAQLEGLDRHEVEIIDPSEIALPQAVISNDPRFLNAEDAAYEDVNDDEDETEAGLLS